MGRFSGWGEGLQIGVGRLLHRLIWVGCLMLLNPHISRCIAVERRLDRKDGLQRLVLLALNLRGVGTAAALELQMVTYGLVEQSHEAPTPYCARLKLFSDYTSADRPNRPPAGFAGL